MIIDAVSGVLVSNRFDKCNNPWKLLVKNWAVQLIIFLALENIFPLVWIKLIWVD